MAQLQIGLWVPPVPPSGSIGGGPDLVIFCDYSAIFVLSS
jgi:hypothetical protein